MYEIQFYDITGNRVYDLDGRKVRIKTPVSEELLGGQMLFGNAADKNVIELYETLENAQSGKNSYIYYELTETEGYKFAITQLTDADDPYWDFLNDDDSDDVSFDEVIPDDLKVDKKQEKEKSYVLPIIIFGAAVAAVGVTVVSVIFIKKRKRII